MGQNIIVGVIIVAALFYVALRLRKNAKGKGCGCGGCNGCGAKHTDCGIK